jgi:hypothetical protein
MMQTATCRCTQLRVHVSGDPLRVSVCHCHECQRRSGSAFAWQGRWPDEAVEVVGKASIWRQDGTSGGKASFYFCSHCGCTVYYTNDNIPGQIAVSIGGFAGQSQPTPNFSVYEQRLQPWLSIIDEDVEHKS